MRVVIVGIKAEEGFSLERERGAEREGNDPKSFTGVKNRQFIPFPVKEWGIEGFSFRHYRNGNLYVFIHPTREDEGKKFEELANTYDSQTALSYGWLSRGEEGSHRRFGNWVTLFHPYAIKGGSKPHFVRTEFATGDLLVITNRQQQVQIKIIR